jgi:F-type H+-transporting ATPase subunit a
MHGHELWFTALLNRYLAGVANALLGIFGLHAHDPAHPWTNYVAMNLLVFLILVVIAPLIRSRLSVERPSNVQQIFEAVYGFLRGQAGEIIGHEGHKFAYYAGTLFFFILFSNLLGIVPTFESPTMYPSVPAGCALATFIYYNYWGFVYQGFKGYMGHFAGPFWWLAWFMFPLEIISHLIRPLSLTIRLYANMLAGEMVTLSFIAMVPLVIPVVLMGLHTLVSFIQAFIFTVLTLVYLSGAVAHEEH